MNISHLIGKRVLVCHISQDYVTTIINGKLTKINNGNYMVFTDSFLMSLFKRIFLKRSDSFIMFHWSSVTDTYENIISLIELENNEECLEKISSIYEEKTSV